MENATFVALSRQMAMHRQMDVIANNLANMNTTAYRGEDVLFEEYLMAGGPNGSKASYVLDWGAMRSTKEGPIEATGNSLDIAISGPGYLSVDTPDGRRYTRNGHLRLNQQGQLSTADGFSILNANNQPIQLNPEDGQIQIARDGTISNVNGPVGRLSLTEFQNEQVLRKVGGNLYSSPDPGQAATTAEVVQGAIEGSNVEPISEMTKMLELTRGYQSIQRMLDAEQDRERRMLDRLSKIT